MHHADRQKQLIYGLLIIYCIVMNVVFITILYKILQILYNMSIFENTTILIAFRIYAFRIADSYCVWFYSANRISSDCWRLHFLQWRKYVRDCVILHPYYVTHVDQNNAFEMKFRDSVLKWRCHFHQSCDPNTLIVVL